MKFKKLFTLTSHNIKYLGINPMKDVQDPTLNQNNNAKRKLILKA